MRLPAAAGSLLGGEFSTGEMGNFHPALTRLVKRSGAIYQMDTASIGKGRDDERSSQLKSCRRLQQDLEEMKSSASPEARRVLNILGNWVRNNSSALSILAAIEALLSELGHPRVTVGRVASMANKK
jgi:hypothetical protein